MFRIWPRQLGHSPPGQPRGHLAPARVDFVRKLPSLSAGATERKRTVTAPPGCPPTAPCARGSPLQVLGGPLVLIGYTFLGCNMNSVP